MESRAPGIRERTGAATITEAFTPRRALQPSVAKFFDDVLVMADDERCARRVWPLVATLRDLILDIADISEM